VPAILTIRSAEEPASGGKRGSSKADLLADERRPKEALYLLVC
jgi:hypothetical protein